MSDVKCFQGDSNGVQVSDPQLFDGQFEKLVCELTEQDITDPVLSDALNRLREVSVYVWFTSSSSWNVDKTTEIQLFASPHFPDTPPRLSLHR